MLTFKIKLSNFGSLFCAEYFYHKFPKFFKENSEKKNKKFIHLLTYAPPYISKEFDVYINFNF